MADTEIEQTASRELSRAQVIRLRQSIEAEWRVARHHPTRHLELASATGDRSIVRDWFQAEHHPNERIEHAAKVVLRPCPARLVNVLARMDIADIWRHCAARG